MFGFGERKSSSGEGPISRSEFDDCIRRLKAVERENDDLHAAYRRLRASQAALAKPEPSNTQALQDGHGNELVVSRKDLLRRTFLPRSVSGRGEV